LANGLPVVSPASMAARCTLPACTVSRWMVVADSPADLQPSDPLGDPVPVELSKLQPQQGPHVQVQVTLELGAVVLADAGPVADVPTGVGAPGDGGGLRGAVLAALGVRRAVVGAEAAVAGQLDGALGVDGLRPVGEAVAEYCLWLSGSRQRTR
jgi:hypothetical protein